MRKSGIVAGFRQAVKGVSLGPALGLLTRETVPPPGHRPWCAHTSRRRLAQDAVAAGAAVTVADLRKFGRTFADLADDSIMAKAWE